ncbi:MAG: molecular chaperone TorD family protein [Acidimicrobiia bacterium]
MSSSPELFRALAVVTEGTSPAHQRVAASLGVAVDPAAYTDLFCFQLPPYASIHLGAEGMLGGEAADRVAGFWRALGLVPPAEPDHLAALLGLYAALAEAEAGEADVARRLLRGEARRALLWEHLLPWVPVYAVKLAGVAPPRYRAWAEILQAALLEAATVSEPPAVLALHLRLAPPPPRPDSAVDELLAGLLAPVRSGMVVTRADLARAARHLGLGLRMGERRFALRSLLDQDAPGMCRWLAGEARWWAEQHDGLEPALGAVARFWCDRAGTTAALLGRAGETASGGATFDIPAWSR